MSRGLAGDGRARESAATRAGAAAAASALVLFAYLTVRGAGLPLPFGLGSAAGLGVLLVLGAAIGLSRFRQILWGAGIALALLVLIVGWTPLVRGPAHALVRDDPWPAGPANGVDAVVVLSASLTDDGQLSSIGLDRLLAGVAAARRHGVAELVTSRITREVGGRTITSDTDQRLLAELGAPALRLTTVAPVESTRDEAVLVRRVAAERGWRRVAVVTSPSHTRRACATFERVGLAVTCVAAPSRVTAYGALRTMADRLRAGVEVLYETAATALYRRRGWIG